MPRRELTRIIESAGFDPLGAKLYVAGLSLGSAPASAFAKKTGVNRVTAYNHLEVLVKRGLFTVIRKLGGKEYAAVSPEEVALEARKNVDALNRVLPELRSLKGTKYRTPQVKFFHGWEGVKRVYEDTLTAESEILNFANSAIVREYWENYDEEYVAERARRGIKLRGIAPDDEEGRRVHGLDRQNLREIRLVPAKDFDFNNEINIYDHKVTIASFGEGPDNLFGIIIESVEVAETQRQIFEMAWGYAALKNLDRPPSLRGRPKQ